MTKNLYTKRLASIGHSINYELGINNTFYSTLTFIWVIVLKTTLFTHSLSVLPVLHGDLIILNERFPHEELGRCTIKFDKDF